MKINKLRLNEFRGEKLKYPEMRYLLGGSGSDCGGTLCRHYEQNHGYYEYIGDWCCPSSLDICKDHCEDTWGEKFACIC